MNHGSPGSIQHGRFLKKKEVWSGVYLWGSCLGSLCLAWVLWGLCRAHAHGLVASTEAASFPLAWPACLVLLSWEFKGKTCRGTHGKSKKAPTAVCVASKAGWSRLFPCPWGQLGKQCSKLARPVDTEGLVVC